MEATILKEQTTESRAPGGISVELLIKRAIEDDNPVKVYDELVPLLALLSPGEYAAAKTELREHFKRRLSVTELDKVVKAARKGQARERFNARAARSTEPGQAARPVVEVGGQLRDVVKSSMDALALANDEKPSLFVQSGRLVSIRFSEKREPTVEPLTLSALRYRMSLSADYVTIRETSEDTIAIAVDPPLDIARVILEGVNGVDYPFPPLSGMTELPIVRPDGSIHQIPGYDAETEKVYIPGDLIIPAIPVNPGPADVAKSLELIDFLISDFPFDSQASRATIIANLIAVVIRSVIKGPVPLTLLDAPKQGTGKTLLAQIVGAVATGRIVPTNAPTGDEEEWRKRIITWLMPSPSVVIIDNLIHPLESSSLNSALTSDVFRDRLLTTNEGITVENNALWFATGNNIRVGDDTARRVIKCRLDARTEKPWKRKQDAFRIKNILKWTIEHRAEIVAAVLTLARNWYAKGRPAPDVTPIGSFEEWTVIVGGILQSAGVTGFLANLEDEDGNSSIDEVTEEWRGFIEAIHSVYQGKPFSCAELAKMMLPEDDSTAELLRDTVPTSITKNLDGYMRSKGVDREFAKHMGIVLKLKKGQMFGTLRLEWKGRNRENKVQWQIIDTTTEGQAETPSHQGQEYQAETPSRPESKEETARKLLNWIEENGGRVSSASNGAVLLTMPVNYPDKLWKQLNARVKSLSLQICQIKNWPVDTGTID